MKSALTATMIATALTFFSCAKENVQSAAAVEIPEDNTKDFLKDVRSDSTAEYFISADYDGKTIYLASTFAESYPYHDTIFNVIYEHPETASDEIHLLRANQDNTVRMALYFSNAFLSERQFPYEPAGTFDQGHGLVNLEFVNMKKIGTTGQNFPNDDFSFFGNTAFTSRVTVNSFVNNVVEGTFDGQIKTNTGSSIAVKNGKFRIKVVIVRSNGSSN